MGNSLTRLVGKGEPPNSPSSLPLCAVGLAREKEILSSLRRTVRITFEKQCPTRLIHNDIGGQSRTWVDMPRFVMRDRYAIVASPRFNEGSDPNGIRTRVTAVKGRCPGPLDDRVTKARAISELPWFHARQIGNVLPGVWHKRPTTYGCPGRSQARESARLRAWLRPGARSRLHAHFERVAGALRGREEARRVLVQVN